MNLDQKIVITGAAGLVGHNLILQLTLNGFTNINALDKNLANLNLIHKHSPNTKLICTDLSDKSLLSNILADADILILLHAQITGKYEELFIANNVNATRNVIEAAKKQNVPYCINISSSVINSKATDFYTETKKEQENIFLRSGLLGCNLRPTLMYGWFDPKHFGWLSRFMEKVPLFPIPGKGNFIRQPLYEVDFCRVIIWCINNKPISKTYDICGHQKVAYVDIIKMIRKVKNLKTIIFPIPYSIFYSLLKIYSLFSKNPPFTAAQLKALTVGDEFDGVDIQSEFGIIPTSIQQGLEETFTHKEYSSYILNRSNH